MPDVAAKEAAFSVGALRVDLVASPLGLENSEPRLSWTLASGRRGARQTGWRVEVASTEAALAAGTPDLWDSGWVESPQTFDVAYRGMMLRSRQQCFWRVTVRDERGIEASAASGWEMGLLEPANWSAEWLGAEDARQRGDRLAGLNWISCRQSSRVGHFRLAFDLDAPADIEIILATLGAAQLWVDGAPQPEETGPQPIGPPRSRALRASLGAGRHALAIEIGPRDSPLRFMVPQDAEMAALVRIEYHDGRVGRMVTGWKASASAPPGWQASGFDDRTWRPAGSVHGSRPALWPKQPAVLLRREFAVRRGVSRARLYITALGGYIPYLNGKRVGDAILAPEATDFRKRAYYRVHDVAEALVPGANVLGAIVGDGWYASYFAGVGRYPWGPTPRALLAQLEIVYNDGTTDHIDSDRHWRLAHSAITASEIYDGEDYDARLEQPGWSTAAFRKEWQPAIVVSAPALALAAQISPPIRRQGSFRAASTWLIRPGLRVFDFGQNFAGWCRLVALGHAGAAVRIRFAESVDAGGGLDRRNLRSARAEDRYILRGDETGETFEPNFTYHGFRYAELEWPPDLISEIDLEGVVIHSDLEASGELAVDHPLIARIARNSLWSQRSNFMGIPTDCPQRDERFGWLGDAFVYWDAASFFMDTAAFTRRFMADLRDSQREDGSVADFSPAPMRLWLGEGGRINVLPDWSDCPSDLPAGGTPGWADGAIHLPWTIWQHYGDTAIIEENWGLMSRHLALVAADNQDGLWRAGRGSDFGDWLAFDALSIDDATTPKDLVATAMWAMSLDRMTQMARATGRVHEARAYADMHRRVADAFRRAFVAGDGKIGNGSQSSYVLALAAGLVPGALRSRAGQWLIADIERRGTLLATGFLGSAFALDVLADLGRGDLAYSLLLRTEPPSWGFMIAQDATTIWENWHGDADRLKVSNSLNHYARGAVCSFLFRRVAGIAAAAPGFRRIAIKPELDARIPSAGGVYRAVTGAIETAWEQHDGGGFTLRASIPPGVRAEIVLPCDEGSAVTESGTSLQHADHVRILNLGSDECRAEVGSGNYIFDVASPVSKVRP